MEKNEILVKVSGLGKKYCKNLKKSLWYGFSDSVNAVFKKNWELTSKNLRNEEFWALQDISFELKRGDCIGLIGHNGAGKSTLLKIINGLIKPDCGTVQLNGKVGALIELGAGFSPILTGRENIFNNASILGFTKKEIESKLESIIAFSEIGEFIDSPVQNYSSGMKVRLGFSIAVHLNPDILLVDEVLAVGDLGFVLKCFQKIDSILSNTAIIFVSHNMPMVSRICTKLILLDKGTVKYQGKSVSTGIEKYYNRFISNNGEVLFSNNSIILDKISINNEFEAVLIKWNETINVDLTFQNNKLNKCPHITISIFDKEQRGVATFNTSHIDKKLEKGLFSFRITHKNLQLSSGVYSINIIIYEIKQKNPILRINNAISFQVLHEEETWPPFLLDSSIEVN